MTCSSGYELFNISSDKFPSKDHRSSTSTMCIYGELSDLDCREGKGLYPCFPCDRKVNIKLF